MAVDGEVAEGGRGSDAAKPCGVAEVKILRGIEESERDEGRKGGEVEGYAEEGGGVGEGDALE